MIARNREKLININFVIISNNNYINNRVDKTFIKQ